MEMPIVWFVSQISMPVRILLIGAAVFLAAWFTLLRPKSETVPPVTTSTTTTPAATSTPQTGLGKAVDAAKKAAGVKTEATATATPATGTATTTTPEVKPENAVASVPADVLAKLPKSVANALTDRKVLVLGVLSEDAKPWRPLADDDRYVRNALKRANRYDGDVVVKNVGLEALSTYGPLVNDLQVTQSPSIVVIDRNLKGTVLTGYVDRVSINQAIADARRNSITPNITDSYLRQANSICGHAQTRISRWSLPTIPGKKAERASLLRLQSILRIYGAKVSKLKAPAKWRGLKTAWTKDLRAERVAFGRVVKAHKSGSISQYVAAVEALAATGDAKLDRRFNEVGLTDCAAVRTS
jgi:hypothetical protein